MTYSRDLTIEWGDCDPAGIVFFPRYLAMFDANTARLIEAQMGMKKIELLTAFDFAGWAMVELQTQFRLPCRFGDAVRIDSSIAEIGRSSFKVRHQLLRDGAIAVEATETRVLIRPDASGGMKARPIPQAMIAALEAARPASGQ